MAQTETKAPPAAYLPFKTFESAIDSLSHGLPRKIDRTIWKSQSGVVQGQIMMAFRFLGLIDDNDEPTPLLQILVESKTDRHLVIGDIIKVAYASVIKMDMTKMTPKMLEDAMGAYGVQGDTKRKAIAFFLRAAKLAELPMHPMLIAQTRNSNGGARRRRKAKDVPETPPQEQLTPSGDGFSKEVVAAALPSGGMLTLTISTKWSEMYLEERNFVYGLIDQVRAFDRTIKDMAEEDEEEPQ
jgi:hypothetical protein